MTDGRGLSFWRKHTKSALASIFVVAIFVWIFRAGTLPLFPARGELARVDQSGCVLFVLGMLVHLLLRYGRCHYLLAPVAHVSLRRVFVINAIGMALITLLPLRLGEFSRPALLREKGKLSAWAVTGTVAAERIIDGLAFSLLLLVGLAVAPPADVLPDHIGSLAVPASIVPGAAKFACAVFGGSFALMLLFYRQRDLARSLVGSVLGLISKPFAERISVAVESVSDGLRFLTQGKYALPYLALTLLGVWVHVWALGELAAAVGIPELTFAQAMVVVGVLALGFAVPNSPGFFGQIQLALYAGLAVYVSPEKVVGPGATLAFLFYVTYLGLVLLLAGVALLAGYGANDPAFTPAEASQGG